MKIETLERYNKARNIIFDNTLINSTRLDFKPLISHTSWNKEFGSITMQFGRQSGATTWMIYKVYEQTLLDKKSIIFSFNLNMISRIKQLYNEKININDNNIDMIEFYSFDRINENFFRGRNSSFIFIDCSQFLSSNKYEIIMKNAFCDLIVLL